ncbi:MAG TPA: ABC transporter ATP-binding protein [Polyangiaceae bacterium]|nr:ABC transporter ATP-binding protein [Polyangiaceae bacterium]
MTELSRSQKKYLEIWQLQKSFPGADGPLVVVEDFNLSVQQGEFVSLIGHSGCGKSTVLSIVAGLAQASAGTVILGNREITEPGPDRGVVFQTPCLFPWMTVLENVTLGLEQVMPQASSAERANVAGHFLELVDLHDSFHKRPSELSQGMRQRVGLARAFALSPKMLLLDEPFGMLDSLTRLELHEVLLTLWRENRKTLLMVTHDVDEALFLSDRVVMMTNGPRATVGEILEVPFARPRDRAKVLEDPEYYALRERLIGFLEDHARPGTASSAERREQTSTLPTPASAPQLEV